MSGRPSVLVVADSGRAEAVADRVGAAGLDVETATDLAAARDGLADGAFGCAVSAESVADGEGGVAAGYDVIRMLRSVDGGLPVVLFGEERASAASDAVAAGLADYVSVGPDGDYDRLVGRVRNAVARRQAVRRAEQQARMNEVIRDVHQALVRADSREAIEESVCEQFARSEQYTFAWIAGVSDGDDGLTFRAMGVEGGAVEGRGAMDVDEGTAFTEPAHRAAERREVVVVRDVDDRGGAWEAALDRPFEAVAAVPFVYEDRVYGVLLLYADRRGAFGEEEQAMLAELGENVAYAMNAVAVRRMVRRRELELRRQNEQLEEFAEVVSHDLRNPLTVARGYAEMLDDERAARKIDDSLARMETIVEDVLALARQGKSVGETEPVDLAAVAREAWGTVDTDDVSLAVADPRTVEADRSRLAQLLENLFRNAVEHGSTSPRQAGDAVEHGSTSPRSQAREDSEARSVSGSRPEADDAVEHGGISTVRVGTIDGGDDEAGGFYVEDDGVGLPEDERDRLFDSGYTTAEDGTGFGLAIVRSIAEAHGWSVAAAESREEGARFEFTGVATAGDGTAGVFEGAEAEHADVGGGPVEGDAGEPEADED